MADKMMRIALRGKDGHAKAAAASVHGHQFVEPPLLTLMNEHTSGEGREIAVGGVWESDVFETEGLKNLILRTSLNKNIPYEIEIVEVIKKNSVAREIKVNKLGTYKANMVTSAVIQMPAFKLRVRNKGAESFSLGVYLHATLGGINSQSRTMMTEQSSADGRQILPNESWESDLIPMSNFNALAYKLTLSANPLFTAELVEYADADGIFETNKKYLGSQIESQNTSGIIRIHSPFVKVTITNLGENPFNIGVSLELLKVDGQLVENYKPTIQLMNTQGTPNISIPPMEDWVSPPLQTFGMSNLTYYLNVPSDPQAEGELELVFLPVLGLQPYAASAFGITAFSSTAPFGENATGTKTLVANFVVVVIKNKSNKTIDLGIQLFASKGGY